MDETGILQLNDYCLDLILQLMDTRGRINFAYTCSRFRDVFLIWSRRGYSKFSVIGFVEPWELKLLSLVAKSVRTLHLFVDDLVCFFNDNCSSKKRLIATSNFCNLIKTMENLEYVKIMQIHPHQLTRLFLKALQDLPNLRQLHVSTPRRESFRKFHRLEFISIDVKISSKDLLQSCRSLNRLRTLHLSEQVSSSNLRGILKLLPHLQELSFWIDRSHKLELLTCHRDQRRSLTRIFDYLGRERNLKTLRVRGEIVAVGEAEYLANIKSLKSLECSFTDPDLVSHLLALTSLESLRIRYLHPIDISSTYLDIIRKCKDLRCLDIYDQNINSDFVLRASKVLEDIQSKNTLRLLTHGRHYSERMRDLSSMNLGRNNQFFVYS
ncbi:uncharacterized protein LOC108027986 [Drosophila biarmipes]|uniref:uncharacterized protein LOC108027986 n=1 Tax=Drosophila biarmipes TaxID=125945 RepID=UPI0007E5CF37|nr:uncharacterized protein LOC108027986 [Drosophila biarmipes]